jgi:DNA-binding PadR family transcriptional regulator
MEKDELIYTLKEERTGARVRKIYDITDKGKEELKKLLSEELLKPIYEIESDKFMLHLMFNKLPKEEIIQKTNEHIKLLEEKKHWWEMGKKLKIAETSPKIEALTFDITISNLDNQIKWHKVLLEDLDNIIEYSAGMENIIKKLDFSNLGDDVQYKTCGNTNLKDIELLKNDILKNPNDLEEKVNQLIELLKK